MKVGIYGGAFNPPHLGHLSAAKAARRELSLDRLFLVPSFISPHKESPAGSYGAEERLLMAGLMAGVLQGAEVCDFEIKNGGTSYTVLTLREFSARFPCAELWLIVGADMLVTIDRWKKAEEIFSLCSVAALSRGEPGDMERIHAHAASLETSYGARVRVILHDALDISSSRVREMLSGGRGREYVTNEIWEYLTRRGIAKSK